MITGLPSILTSVSLFPLVLATTSVFPDALGVGVSRSAVIMSLLPSIFAVIAMIFPPGLLGLFLIEQRHAKKHIGDVVTYVALCHPDAHSDSTASRISYFAPTNYRNRVVGFRCAQPDLLAGIAPSHARSVQPVRDRKYVICSSVS
jgi:hypothetical protein